MPFDRKPRCITAEPFLCQAFRSLPAFPQRLDTQPLCTELAGAGNKTDSTVPVFLQAITQAYDPGNSQTLQQFIIYFGILQLLLSQLPDVHSLRFVNFVATFCTISFTVIATGVSIHNGQSSPRPD